MHPKERVVECHSLRDGLKFFVEYDVLAISTGSQGSTFGIPGVPEYTMPLRDAANSTSIRNKLIQNWAEASIPGRDPAERARLLHVAVVGGGPTGVEFAGELADFVRRDLSKIDPNRARDVRITLIEADQLLGSFDTKLREYAALKLTRAGVHLVKGIVKEVRRTELELKSGAVIPYGLCVWSTGVGPTMFSLSLPFEKTMRGRLAIDDKLRCQARLAGTRSPTSLEDVSMVQEELKAEGAEKGRAVPRVYALGDVAANLDKPLPALAQVAEQQGKYLAASLNAAAAVAGSAKPAAGTDALEEALSKVPAFEYNHLGSMASVGGHSAVIELKQKDQPGHLRWTGFSSWIAWRSAYLTRLGTLKHRLYVMSDWTMSLIFGRCVDGGGGGVSLFSLGPGPGMVRMCLWRVDWLGKSGRGLRSKCVLERLEACERARGLCTELLTGPGSRRDESARPHPPPFPTTHLAHAGMSRNGRLPQTPSTTTKLPPCRDCFFGTALPQPRPSSRASDLGLARGSWRRLMPRAEPGGAWPLPRLRASAGPAAAVRWPACGLRVLCAFLCHSAPAFPLFRRG